MAVFGHTKGFTLQADVYYWVMLSPSYVKKATIKSTLSSKNLRMNIANRWEEFFRGLEIHFVSIFVGF